MCVAAVEAPPSMQDQYAPVKYVHSRITCYYASVVDLRWCRAIHSCNECAVQQQLARKQSPPPEGTVKKLCGAVHYGICSAVRLAPVTPNGPRTPQTPPATNGPRLIPIAVANGTKTVSSVPVNGPRIAAPPEAVNGPRIVAPDVNGPRILAPDVPPLPEAVNGPRPVPVVPSPPLAQV